MPSIVTAMPAERPIPAPILLTDETVDVGGVVALGGAVVRLRSVVFGHVGEVSVAMVDHGVSLAVVDQDGLLAVVEVEMVLVMLVVLVMLDVLVVLVVLVANVVDD